MIPISQEVNFLKYAMYAHGASYSVEHVNLRWSCYQKARSFMELTELEADDAKFMSIEALQASLLIALFELKCMFFARAWVSLGRAIRLAQMLRLHKMDQEDDLTVLGNLGGPPDILPADWSEMEEKRRAFWVAFILDRFSNIGTDWSMMIDESEVSFNQWHIKNEGDSRGSAPNTGIATLTPVRKDLYIPTIRTHTGGSRRTSNGHYT